MPSGTPRAANRSGPVARNGLSLACDGCSLSEPPSQGQSFWPATSLPKHPYSLPVRIFRSATVSGSPRPPATSPRQSRCRLASALNGCSCDLHFPSGLLPPSGSKRSIASAATRPAFRIRPISSRSPTPVLFLGSASDHRFRSATFEEQQASGNVAGRKR